MTEYHHDPSSSDDSVIDALAKIQCAIEGRTRGFSLDEVVAPGIERWMRHRYEAEILLRDIHEAGYVFEQAYTPTNPTDDEREAEARKYATDRYREVIYLSEYNAAVSAFVEGAMWRSSEVPMPDWASDRSADFDIATARPLGPEPQGEPFDAQVRAAGSLSATLDTVPEQRPGGHHD